jgi:hypothetical protein
MAKRKRSLKPRGSVATTPHWSWGIDQPLFFVQQPDPDGTDHAEHRHAVTPEEVWAVIDSEF